MFEECIYFNLATLTRSMDKLWSEAFGRLGLSPSPGYLLFAIAECPGTSQKQLAELLELDASTITRFIDGLAAKGLLEKKSRGKGAAFTLTPRGQKVRHEVKKTMDLLFNEMQAQFGQRRFKSFVDDLRKAKQSFKEKKP